MSNSIATANLNKTAKNTELIKLLVFEIGELTLALPILQVQRVIRQTEIHGSGLSYVNLAHLEAESVTVVDLHQKLFGVSTNRQQSTGFFIITRNEGSESLGIAVAKSPSLIEIPLDRIRLLPAAYRHADTLEIASHVTIVTQAESTTTIFILDLERLL